VAKLRAWHLTQPGTTEADLEGMLRPDLYKWAKKRVEGWKCSVDKIADERGITILR